MNRIASILEKITIKMYRKDIHISYYEFSIGQLECRILNDAIKCNPQNKNNAVLLTKYRRKLKLLKF